MTIIAIDHLWSQVLEVGSIVGLTFASLIERMDSRGSSAQFVSDAQKKNKDQVCMDKKLRCARSSNLRHSQVFQGPADPENGTRHYHRS